MLYFIVRLQPAVPPSHRSILRTGVDKGAQPPAMAGQNERKGVFLSDVQHVYLYSVFNWNSKVLLKKPDS